MIAALFLSIGQLGDRAVIAVFAKSLALTLAIFAGLGVATWFAVHAALAAWAGWRDGGAASALVAAVVAALALWLLFRAVAIAVVGLFADDIVAAVEARHYPAALAAARRIGPARAAAMGLRAATCVILVNLLMLPIYLLLLVTGIGTAAAFFLVNGWLLGRDLGDMVAARHLDAAAMRDWRKATAGRRFLLGLAETGLFVVPVVNLAAPVLGAAMATHLFHRSRR